MAFVNNKNIQVGDRVKNNSIITSMIGSFEEGTELTIIGVSERGYDIQDNNGHRMIEVGWNFTKI